MIVIASWVLYHFLAPASWRDWTGAGLVQAFIIALYAEMYGFPLTLYSAAGTDVFPAVATFPQADCDLITNRQDRVAGGRFASFSTQLRRFKLEMKSCRCRRK